MTNQTDAGKSLDLTEILPVMTRREWDCELNPPNCSKSQYDKWYESIHSSILRALCTCRIFLCARPEGHLKPLGFQPTYDTSTEMTWPKGMACQKTVQIRKARMLWNGSAETASFLQKAWSFWTALPWALLRPKGCWARFICELLYPAKICLWNTQGWKLREAIL